MNRRRAFHILFALVLSALGVYIGLVAIEQGATTLGLRCWLVTVIVEYVMLISAPDGHAGRKNDREE
jgi:hypothetical protein